MGCCCSSEGVYPHEDDMPARKRDLTVDERGFVEQALKNAQFFCELKESQRRMVVESMHPRETHAGELIIEEGTTGDEFFVVASGVYDCTLAKHGKDAPPVSSFEHGNWFGELALVYNMPRAASIRCREPGVLLSLGRTRYTAILSRGSTRRSTMTKKGGGRRRTPQMIKSESSAFASVDLETLKEKFREHDTSKTGTLTRSELMHLLSEIFGEQRLVAKDSTGASIIDTLLDGLDSDGSGDIDLDELIAAWRAWFGAAMHPVRALLIIDVQNDFIAGSLALKSCPAGQDGAKVVPVINELRSSIAFDHVAISLDWHPKDHCSFWECARDGKFPAPVHSSQDANEARKAALFTQVVLTAPNGKDPMPQSLWPRHCVQNTWGSSCDEYLMQRSDDIIVYKGTNARVDSYSAFFDNSKWQATTMLAELRERGVTHVYLTGLALDVCVAFTALHAAEEGFVVTVIEDACAGVTLEGIAEKKKIMEDAGVTIVQSNELPGLVKRSSIMEALQAVHRIKKVKEHVDSLSLENGHGSHHSPNPHRPPKSK